MKIFHPEHHTASSQRTSGMPLIAVGDNGRVTNLGGTRKRAGLIEIPEDTVIILHGYTSNSGKTSILAYHPQNGMELITEINASEGPDSLNQLPIANEAYHWAMSFLFE